MKARSSEHPCFTLVCLRQLEEPIAFDGSVVSSSLSHDRRLLSLRDRRGTCTCYSCDSARPTFKLRQSIVQDVERDLWLHLPSEKTVLLDNNVLSEYPGMPCLAALQKGSSALTLCRFFRIQRPTVSLVDDEVRLSACPEELARTGFLLEWGVQELPESLLPNTIWRCTIEIRRIFGLIPNCASLTAEDEDEDPAASCKPSIRLTVARPNLLGIFLNDIAAMLLEFDWRGIKITQCFFLQHPNAGLDPAPAPVEFCDIVACQDWIFAVTMPPSLLLLIWSISGVAFHAIPLREYLDEDVHFLSLVVALDLLGIALCDNKHSIWIISLDRYFDAAPKGLDWELLRERQRSAEGVPVMERTGKMYQELTLFPEAFGLPVHGDWSAGFVRRKDGGTSVLDCLVEGVPTYGIPIPGGAFGVGDPLFGRERPGGYSLRGDMPNESDFVVGAGKERDLSQQSPYAWHERIRQTQDWPEMDRRWTFARAERFDDGSVLLAPGGSGEPRISPTTALNGFSIPAQHRLGDDDLHYSLCAALHKHAQRQFRSRLPPWLTHALLPRKAQRFNPPMLDALRLDENEGECLDAGSDSGNELADDVPVVDASPPSSGAAHGAEFQEMVGASTQASFEALRKEMALVHGGCSSPQSNHRRKVQIGRISLSITATHVFCEVWEARAQGLEPECPWGVCVIPRPARKLSSQATMQAQVDHLTGGLVEFVTNGSESQHGSVEQTLMFRSRRKWMSLLTQNHIWYMLGEEGHLYALLLNQSPVRIISNLLVFENRAKASRLCLLNGWNAKQLPVLTLFLGLRFRELDQIRTSLGLLRPDQEMEACQMIIDFIHSGYSCANLALPFSPSAPPTLPLHAPAPAVALMAGDEISSSGFAGGPSPSGGARDGGAAGSGGGGSATAGGGGGGGPPSSQLLADHSFVSRLLEIAMQFVTKLIQTRVTQIQECEGACRALTYLQPTHAASEPAQYALMVHELSRLTVHMPSLRALQQQLIVSFGDDRAYDSGIVIPCPSEEDKLDQAAQAKTGLTSLDAAIALATKLQAGEATSKEKAAKMGAMRSAEGTEAIVRGALISGRVSSALNWFHEMYEAEAKQSGSTPPARARVFEEFRVTAGRLAYQLMCNQQVDFLFVAMHMLRNVGESVNRFFKAVAFHTSKRLVRRRLLTHLDHMRRLTDDDEALISLVNLLELLYTNPCYTTEFNRMTTSLTTGRYPQRAHSEALPPFFTWPAGGREMLFVGLRCDGAIGGHIGVDMGTGELAFEQQTSLRELPMSQRMPLELHDMWSGYQTPVMAAMLEVPTEARRAWACMECGDIEDLDARPVLGLSNFHKNSNLETDQGQEASIADLRDVEGGDVDGESTRPSNAVTKTTCHQCRCEGLRDDLDAERPDGGQSRMARNELAEKIHLGIDSPKHFTMGYLHVTLSWMRRWSWATRARIIMERTHYRPSLVESLVWLKPPPGNRSPEEAWRCCWLDFLVAHQDWRGLAAWVRRMPLRQSDRVDEYGRSCVDLSHLEVRGLPYCTSYSREILLQELGRRGIFCQGDAQSFPALLRRLAQCGRLFGDEATLSDGIRDDREMGPDGEILTLQELLPRRDVRPFHRFFIHFCIDHDLPTVMLTYLQSYELATTMGDLKALEIKHAAKPWASLLLVGRLGNAHLFAASLQHAAIVFDGSSATGGASGSNSALSGANGAKGQQKGRVVASSASVWHDAEDVPLMPLNSLADNSPLAFLATLMFAPAASALHAAEAHSSTPWYIDVGKFWRVVKEYPALSEAFFPRESAMVPALSRVGIAGMRPRRLTTSLMESVANASQSRWSSQNGDAAPCATPGGRPVEGADAQTKSAAGDKTLAGGNSAASVVDTLPGRAGKPANADVTQERLQKTLDDMTTFKEDVSLSQLLSDVAAFDVQQALRRLPIFPKSAGKQAIAAAAAAPTRGAVAAASAAALVHGSNGNKSREHGSLTTLVESKEKFQDELGEGYFLAQGRAMTAFHVLMTKCARQAAIPGELKFPLVLPAEDARRLHKVAKSVALYNLLNEGVVSSAVCLLELCSLETEMLRVDVQAAKRIYEHQVRMSREGGRGECAETPLAAAASVIELFLSFPDIVDSQPRAAEAAINSGHLLTALRMLEESTWALDPHPSAPTVSSLQALAYDSPWHLVALFCRVHSLPRSLTLLHELARNNDWVKFLHESDLQQSPADIVLDIVDGYFTDVPLQSHLRILAHSIATQEQDDNRSLSLKGKDVGGRGGADGKDQSERAEARAQEAAAAKDLKLRSESDVRRTSDALDFIERCRFKMGGATGTGWGLLQHALSNRVARLAVVASAFSDVSTLQCMAVWLTVNTERSSGFPAESSGAAHVTGAGNPAQSSPAEVAGQIASLCQRSHAFSLVLRAMKIFDPANPLVDFVKFHRAFVQCRFQSCSQHLRRFVERRESESLSSESVQEPCTLELVPHVVSLSEEMVQYLLDSFPRARMMLLSALDQADFSPHYSHLYRSFRLIQQSGLDVDFRMPAGDLLQLLISRKMFAEAREWARSSGIVGDTIVFEEVTGMIVEFRQGVWWNVLDERLRLWHRCYDAFIGQKYPPVGAALFFLDMTSKFEPDLFAREQLMLLCIAFELLSRAGEDSQRPGRDREDSPAGLPSGAGSAVDELAPQQPPPLSTDQLSQIKLCMLLILTGTNRDLAAELDFAPLDLSYKTLQTLARRIPEGVVALPLYHASAGRGDDGSKALGGMGHAALVPALVPEQRGPRSELLPYLDTAISSLINCDEIVWAKELASGFSFESVDLHLAEVLEMVASGNHREALCELHLGHAPIDAPNPEGDDAEQLLKTLSTQCSSRISLFCRRCMVFYFVSRTIGMDYRQVSQVDVGELLDRLLSPQPYVADMELCRSLLACYPKHLNKATLAEVLANRFVRSTLEAYPAGARWSEEKLEEFVCLLGSSQELLGDAALCRIPNFRSSHGAAAVGRAATEGQGAGQGQGNGWALESSGTGGGEDGEELDGGLPWECEVEVLILAYYAYVQACHERSIGDLLRFLQTRVELYVERRRFSLLLRLLVAIPEYHAMEYMFGHLVHHGQLDLLLQQGRLQSGAPKPALAVALVRYVQDRFPRKIELLVKVHVCFGLEAQLADLLEQKAIVVTHSVGRKWERICSEEGEEKLLMCLSLFLQCSRFYLNSKRYQKHLVANERAALICLQLKAVQIHLAASLQEQQAAQRQAGSSRLSRHNVPVHSDCPGMDEPLLAAPLAAVPPLPAGRAASWESTLIPAGEAAVVAAAAGSPSVVSSPGGPSVSGAHGTGGATGDGDLLLSEDAAEGSMEPEDLSAIVPNGADAPCHDGDAAGGSPKHEGEMQVVDGHGHVHDRSEEDRQLAVVNHAPAQGGKASEAGGAPNFVLGPAGDPFVVINLEAAEVRVFAEYHHDFVVAFQVVCAYRHSYGEDLARVWPRALYRQVVLLGNRSYLQFFLLHLPLTREHLESVGALYLNESCPEQFPNRAQRMKHFLCDGVPNLEIRYQLARQLGPEFADVSMETASLVYMA